MDLVVGANSGLGRSLSEELARRGHKLILCGRDQEELMRLSQDLKIRFGNECQILVLDIGQPLSADGILQLQNLASQIVKCYLLAGHYNPNLPGQSSLLSAQQLIHTNFYGPVEIIEILLQNRSAVSPNISLLIASTMGAVRPRGRGAIYCASKAGLEFYAESLLHALSGSVKVTVVRFGYLDTSMSYGQKLLLPTCSPENAARRAIEVFERNDRLAYVPGWWRGIAFCLKLIPNFVFRLLRR